MAELFGWTIGVLCVAWSVWAIDIIKKGQDNDRKF